jgi:outer membrane biosynthesis protein TonB
MINAAAAQPIAAVVTQPKSENLKSDSIKEQPKTEAQTAINEEVAQVKPQPEPKKEPVVDVKKDTATIKRPDPAKEEPAMATTKTDAVKEPVVEAKKSNETPKAETVTASAKSDPKTEISKAPAPEKGISYKVQIMAAHRTVGKAYFQQRHNYSGEFSIENHEGWVKYTTGRHSVYADARNARETIRSKYNFDGPFVTAYNDGVRITVQEALMISNQQWVK